MYQSDWARLIKAGVPIETIAQVANVPTHVIEQALEAQAKQRAKIRTLHEMQPAGPETPARKKPGKRKGRLAKNPKKICPQCQTTFSRARLPCGKLISRTEFARRKFCSPACSSAAQRDKTVHPDWMLETKTCRHCQTPFGRPKYLNDREKWAKRLYCSNACRLTSQSQLFAAARAPIAPQPRVPEVAIFRILSPITETAPGDESDAEYLIRLCGGEAA